MTTESIIKFIDEHGLEFHVHQIIEQYGFFSEIKSRAVMLFVPISLVEKFNELFTNDNIFDGDTIQSHLKRHSLVVDLMPILDYYGINFESVFIPKYGEYVLVGSEKNE